jgi:putative hydrolase of the HAD superfamily
LRRQHLLFDADDTLWENNIYFEEAFHQFCHYLAHSSLSPVEVRAVLDEIEIINAKVNGYGSRNFGVNLTACFQQLAERDISDADLEAVRDFAHAGIVKEKNETAYRELVQQRQFRPERTWMIGNSPKSDINPALAAGLNAVYVPHPRTWSLECEMVPDSHPRLLRVIKIRELTVHF